MRKPKLTRRFVALFLAVLIFFGTLPYDMITNAADTNTSGTTVADTATVDGWKQYFSSNSTKYAGHVFVDKSVFTAEEAKAYFENDISEKLSFGKDNFGNQNFLVTLSSIASNTEISGYSAAPTDTMLVLDLSGSMKNSGYVDEMVEGANHAIDLLLNLNKNNRIGVVLYSGNQSSNDAATTSTATTILPLGRYTTDDYYKDKTSGKYLKVTSDDKVLKVGLESSVKTEDTKKKVEATKKTVAGGTYMQNGIYFAYNQFLSATDKVIPEGNIQAGIKRMPIMVFMGDGAPTIGTTSYNHVETSNKGNGTASSKELSFLTQLTAAWTKAKVSSMYDTDMRLYTLGIGTTNNQDATDVLNPMNTNSKTAALWKTMLETKAEDGTITIKYDKETLQVPKDPDITNVNQRGYVNSYTTASTTAQIVTAFENIAKDIEKQSKVLQNQYYATLVNTDAEHDGYVSFSDEIGYGMEIKNIKGIHLGKGKLMTGDTFAKYITTANESIDTELIASLKSRFDISETQVRQLLTTAKKNGDIAYKDASHFSNYVSWYAKEDNTYITPYVKGSDASVPKDAKYLMKSYIYLGDTMMYTLVRIKEDIKTGYQVMELNLPAAMLPMVTYSLKIDGEKIVSMTCNAKEQSPAMLLYEVGLKDSITPYNIGELNEAFQANADGTYSFYTNRWNGDDGKAFTVPKDAPEGLFSHGLMDTTVAHFVPATENDHYYYTEDTELYVRENENYKLYNGSEILPGTDYYFQFRYVVKDDKNYKVETEYKPVSEAALTHVKKEKNVWYIKKGTQKNFLEIDGHTYEAKNKNETGTLAWSLYRQVKKEGYHVLGYLGNNGKLTVFPAQGIKLTKAVAEAVPNVNDRFTFQIELTGKGLSNSYPAMLVKADGTTTNKTLTVSDGSLSVTIGAGDTIYISELPTGTKYQVKENYHADYVPISKNESGTIEENKMQEVTFVNTPRGYGSLLISKKVTHQFETAPEALTKKTFPITVTFSGELEAVKSIPTPQNAKRTDDRTFTVDLANGTEVLFTNLPEGIEYQVSENLDVVKHKGFTLKTAAADLKGTISPNHQSKAALINEYAPEAVSPSLELIGKKYVDGDGYQSDATYQIMLQEVVIGEGTMVNKGNPTLIGQIKKGETYQYDMSQIEYKKAGSYSYMIYEAEPADGAAGKPANVAYDKSVALFTIEVTDDDADGKLEVKDHNIRIHQNSAMISQVKARCANTTIRKDFRNMYQATTISFKLKKTVNQKEDSPYDGNIMFGLYESASEQRAIASAITDENGNATISLNVKQSDYAVKKYYYVRETAPDVSNRVVGMTYDDSAKYVITIQWNGNANEPTVEYFHYDANRENGVGEKLNAQANPVLKIDNSYDGNVTSTPEIMLSGTKTLQGREWNEKDEFAFELYVTGADFKTDGLHAKQKKTVTKDSQTIRFDAVTFDSVGTKYMVIKEVNNGKGGISYDTTDYRITVKVVKAVDANGKTILSVAKKDGGNVLIHKNTETTPTEETHIDFKNQYTVRDEKFVRIRGLKTITGRQLIAGEFTFELYEDGNENAIETVTNQADGSFSFPIMTYKKAGTYKYTVKEQIPESRQGVTYDETVHQIEVTLSDNGEGGFTKTVTLNGQQVETADITVQFENSYAAASTELCLSGEKRLVGRTLNAEEFTFGLYEADQSFQVTNSVPVKTAKNSDTGAYSITLNYHDGEEGSYYYVLSEKQEETDANGVLYDTTEYYISVNVSDDGKGQLHVDISNITSTGKMETVTGKKLNFRNEYQADVTDGIQITGFKELEGRDMKAEEFEFLLYEADEAYEKIGSAIATAKNKKDSSFMFDRELKFEEVGIYYYVVTEKNLGEEGMAYDDTAFGVKIIVTDNELGKLISEVQYLKLGDIPEEREDIVFQNVYTPNVPAVPKVPNVPNVPEVPAKTESPKTGDSTNLALWIAVMFVCGGPLITITICRKREYS